MKNRKIVFIVVALVCFAGIGLLTVRQIIKKEAPQELGYHDVDENDIFETGYVGGVVSSGPMNPDFMEFTGEPGAGRKSIKPDAEGEQNFGWVPSPDMPEVHKPEDVKARAKSLLLSKYDLRDPNGDGDMSDSLVPPVRDQGNCGACWSFASYGALEVSLLGFYGHLDDFSENNMIGSSGYDWGACGGGNIDMSLSYLSRNAGPVRESADPYDDNDSGYCVDCPPEKYIDAAVKLPVRSGGSDYEYIKRAVSEHGALYASMYWGSGYYNYSDRTYYYPGRGTNHAVTIIGWDDDKDIDGAPGRGAFIIRNSWGKYWGEDGYFYISYYDSSLGGSAIAYFIDKPDSLMKFDRIYYYDQLGKTSSTGYGSDTAWGANIFTAENDGNIVAVSLFTNSSTTSYDIYIYDTFNGSTFRTIKGGPYSGTLSGKGYHTIALSDEVSIEEGEDFSVVVKFRTIGYKWPVPVEKPFSGYSSAAVGEAGQGYVSSNGSRWTDITDLYTNSSVCIKALVREEPCGNEGIYVEGPGKESQFLIDNGQGTFIMAVTVDDCGVPLTGAEVMAQLSDGEQELALHDDGAHGDGGRNDGLYAVELSGSEAAKAKSVSVSASIGTSSVNKGEVVEKSDPEGGGGGGSGCFIGALF